ncbi:DUF389 domain-containing protein [Aggregatilinea lenta]|uniref:DUF389 domain-containing protein n=1 Tax=Aggregatilinea lenta TaxID=913108 RepID=UPI000E5C2FA0|nr:DUF389 domain-containing protein [Aggregatilinea lenta]
MGDDKTNQTLVDTRRVLVPVANPATAPDLIRLACKLATPQKGDVWALYVVLGSGEDDSEPLEELQEIVEKEHASGSPVELLTRSATSVARGILDSAREQGATLLLMGFEAQSKGKVELGPVVDAVARTTPCDLLVFRTPPHVRHVLEDIDRIILPLDGREHSQIAARFGVFLAGSMGVQASAVHVQTTPNMPSWYGLGRIEASLQDVPDARQVQRQVVQAGDIAAGILSRSDPDDLIVLAFSERSSLDRWIYGTVTQRVLAQASGPVLVVKRAMRDDLPALERAGRLLLARFSPTLTPYERSEVERVALETSHVSINFVVLMLLSSVLASFGLLQNSSAVIIGAMLVAPLMSPLMSFSVGLIRGQPALLRRSALTTGIGVLIALLVAILVGVSMPVNFSTAEMLARGQPSLIDMGVALASGAAGAYALARKDIPSALAGVAIAAALVPPLCTGGLALAFGDSMLASGAGLLFLTNIVSISLAGAVVFMWLGVRPGEQLRMRFGWGLSLGLLLLLTVPLGSAFLNAVRMERQTDAARSILEAELPDADVLEVKLTTGDPLLVTATVLSSDWVSSVAVYAAQNALTDEFDEDVKLTVTNWRAITPQQAEPSDPGIRP